jgi:N-acetylmuramoyl-L-alanine amidase
MIVNHKLTTANFIVSPNHSGVIVPKFIVMHYTAGWNASGAISTLISPASKASAHIVVDYNGSITQLVPFNIKAWHAGPSTYAGYTGLNSHSIGIEIVNPGFLKKVGDKFQDAYGTIKTASQVGEVVESVHPRVGNGTYYWPVYSPAQLDAVASLTTELIDTYSIIDIVSHEEIDTRGWKTDPGPAFPMNRFKKLLPDRNADVLQYSVTPAKLNVRGGPGTNFEVIGSIHSGDIVEILQQQDGWGKIDDAGWIHMGFIRRI